MPIPADRLAEILDVTEDGIITVNARHEIVLYNRGAARLFGHEPAEVLGRPLDVLIPPAARAMHAGHVEEFATGPVSARVMSDRRTISGRRKDGSEFPVEITISRSESGGERYLTAIVRDAAERKKYEDALLRLNHELEKRVRERTAELADKNLLLSQKTEESETFVYSVSHDLRSPLVNLEGFSQELEVTVGELDRLLADERIPPELRRHAHVIFHRDVHESVGFIRTAVGRLSAIIDALLRLSRAGRVVYQPHTLDMTALARRVVDALRRTTEEKGAVVVVGDMPSARGDATAVEQVFANLVGNSLNYLDPARPGRVEVGSAESPDGPKDLRTFFVRDNGMGIPAAHQPKLFQALQRLHPDKAPGEGIGLAIVRRILERLGGSIRVESEVGRGTTFYFTLPAARESEQAERPDGEPTPDCQNLPAARPPRT